MTDTATRPGHLTHGAYALAALVGVARPDELTSPGADLLLSVQDIVNELAEDDVLTAHAKGDPSWCLDGRQGLDRDSLLPYSHDRWLAFADLCLYSYEDGFDRLGSTVRTSSLTDDLAGGLVEVVADDLARLLIAERGALLEALDGTDEDDASSID